MSDTYQSEMWLMAAGGIVVAILGICCKFTYKLKINDCSLCWGIISVKRDINDELEAAANGGDIENRSDDIPQPTFPATRRLSLPRYSLTHPDRCGENIPL